MEAAVAERGQANVVLATGNSQLAFLAELVRRPVDWSRVVLFHMDEYLGMGPDHPASFGRYIRERVAAEHHHGRESVVDPERHRTVRPWVAKLDTSEPVGVARELGVRVLRDSRADAPGLAKFELRSADGQMLDRQPAVVSSGERLPPECVAPPS